MDRRSFVKSVVATSVIGLGGMTAYQWYQQNTLDYSADALESLSTQFLNKDDLLLLQVFIPVLAKGLPVATNFRTSIYNIDRAIGLLPQRTRQELRELLDLLASGFGRLVLAGIWLNWQQAEPQKISTFLSEWRESRLSLLQQAYIGLHQLVFGAIYAEAEQWPAIGYPGPIKLK